jgi:hypothetical protein
LSAICVFFFWLNQRQLKVYSKSKYRQLVVDCRKDETLKNRTTCKRSTDQTDQICFRLPRTDFEQSVLAKYWKIAKFRHILSETGSLFLGNSSLLFS